MYQRINMVICLFPDSAPVLSFSLYRIHNTMYWSLSFLLAVIFGIPQRSPGKSQRFVFAPFKREMLEIIRFVWCVAVVRFAWEELSDQKTCSTFLRLSFYGWNVNVSMLDIVCFMASPLRFVSPPLSICFYPQGNTHLNSFEIVLYWILIEQFSVLHSDIIG